MKNKKLLMIILIATMLIQPIAAYGEIHCEDEANDVEVMSEGAPEDIVVILSTPTSSTPTVLKSRSNLRNTSHTPSIADPSYDARDYGLVTPEKTKAMMGLVIYSRGSIFSDETMLQLNLVAI